METAALVLAAAVPTAAVVLVAVAATVSMTFVEIQVKVAFTKVRVNVCSCDRVRRAPAPSSTRAHASGRLFAWVVSQPATGDVGAVPDGGVGWIQCAKNNALGQ